MRHYHIDWDSITGNFDADEAANGLWAICNALQKIETVYDSDAELKGLNLPLYSFVSTKNGLDPDRGAVRIQCGWNTAVLPIKKIGVLQEVIPCHRAHAVVTAVLKAENAKLDNSEAHSHDKYNLQLRHVAIAMEHGLGNYEVITTYASYRELETTWLLAIR